MAGDLCEIGSIPLPNATWLTDAVSLFQQSYGEVHPFIATMLCAIGIIMNVATVIVLTRPSMISPVNVLLCAVAICDILVMTSTLIFVVHFHFVAENRCTVRDFSYGWAVFTIVHAHVSVIFHATSIWLTVSLAQIRVLTIRRATAGPTTNITERFSIILAIVTIIIMAAVNLPNFLTFEIDEVPAEMYLSCLQIDINADDSGDVFVTTNDFVNGTMAYMIRAHEEDCMKLKMAFWSNGMIFKVVPCLLLTVSIVALLKIIADVSNKRKNLAQVMKKKVPKDHTTPMLVAVLSIFLIAELPQGLMLVLTGIFSSENFKKKIYLPLGDFMDFLSLLNSAIGFFIYVGMSRKFRSVFFQLFFSLIHCSPYYGDDDEFFDPELSETLQLLDERQREMLCRQQKRAALPLTTRIYHLSCDCLYSLCYCCCSKYRRQMRREQRRMSMRYSQRSRQATSPTHQLKRATSRRKNVPLIVAAATGTTITELSRRNMSNAFTNNGISVASVIQFLPEKPEKLPQRNHSKRRSTKKATLKARHSIGGQGRMIHNNDQLQPIQHRHSLGTNTVRPFMASMRRRLLSERRSGRRPKLKCEALPNSQNLYPLSPSQLLCSMRDSVVVEKKIITQPQDAQFLPHSHNNNSNYLKNFENVNANSVDSSLRLAISANSSPIRQMPYGADQMATQLWSGSEMSTSKPHDEKQSPLHQQATPITTNWENQKRILSSHYSIDFSANNLNEYDPQRFPGFKYRTAYKKLSEMRERGEPVTDFSSIAFPNAAHRSSIFLNVEELDRRRWSNITTGTASFATDPSGAATFLSGYVFGEITPTLHDFAGDYYEDESGGELRQLGVGLGKGNQRRLSKDPYPSTVTFGLSSFVNDPPTNPPQSTSSNFLTVPPSTTLDSKRLSLMSNAISSDIISTQCSHAPLVVAPKSTKPIGIHKRSPIKERVGILVRIREWLNGVWRSIGSSFSSIHQFFNKQFFEAIQRNNDVGSPLRRLNQIQAESNFSGFVY